MDPQIIFGIFSLLLLLLVLAFLLPPLLRKPTDVLDDRREQNIRITRHQLAELEAEYNEGKLDKESYRAAKEELEDALYNDLEGAENTSKPAHEQSYSRVTALLVALLVPALTIALYFKQGQPKAIPESSVVVSQAGNSGKSKLSLEQMLTRLEKKLEAEPDNFTGWVMLGRSYMVVNRPADAVKAYQKALDLNAAEPSVLLQMADALGTSQAGDLRGKPEQLIHKALALQPDNLMGLWLAGMSARQRGDNAEAVIYWKKVLPRLDPASKERQEVLNLIKTAGGEVPAATAEVVPSAKTTGDKASATVPSITVTVTVSDALKARTNPEQTVFIYAKAVSGPPMPLAAIRKKVGDLPLTLTLDDSQAMMPQLKLSGFQQVTVGARVSVSGTPTKSSGDLYVEQSPVKVGTSLSLIINQVAK